jgi:hypothetical protein
MNCADSLVKISRVICPDLDMLPESIQKALQWKLPPFVTRIRTPLHNEAAAGAADETPSSRKANPGYMLLLGTLFNICFQSPSS